MSRERAMGSNELAEMAREASGWMSGAGPQAATVLSSRVRLARNLREHPFPHRAKEKDLEAILKQVNDAVEDVDPEGRVLPLSIGLLGLGAVDRQLLFERHLVGRELAADGAGRAVKVGEGEAVSLMVNEEDHLRLQSLQSGLALSAALERALALDRRLEGALPLAFSPEWGYLTACPTNTGTGLRASVLLHLPGLMLTKQIQRVLQGISQVGLAVRGLYGEGSEVMGNFFQVSNQTTLGQTEEELIESLERVVRQIIEREERAKEVLLKDARPQVEDKVWRAYGILRHCRRIDTQEVLALGSAVRLGVSLGLIPDVTLATLNRLMTLTQSAHLQKSAGRPMDAMERDVRRAEVTRALLEESGGTLA